MKFSFNVMEIALAKQWIHVTIKAVSVVGCFTKIFAALIYAIFVRKIYILNENIFGWMRIKFFE